MLSAIYKDVETRALELEDQGRRLRQLFKPWPPPSQHEEEPPPAKTEEPAPPPAEVIPAEEQAELVRIEKLLSKAQIARNTHRKITRELQKETGSVSEQSQMPPENTADTTANSDNVNEPEIPLENQELVNKIDSKHVNKQNIAQQTASVKESRFISVSKQNKTENSTNTRRTSDKVSAGSKSTISDSVRTKQTGSETAISDSSKTKQTGSERTTTAQSRRPGSSSGRRKVVPAHISAPFQTNPNLPTSKLQTTYRSATSVKSAARGRGSVSSARGRVGGVTSSGRASSSSSSKSGVIGNHEDRNTNSTTSASSDPKTNERDKQRLNKESEGLEYRDKVRHIDPRNCIEGLSNDKLFPRDTVIGSETVINNNSGTQQDEAGVMDADNAVDKFDLRRDGSTIELPVKLRKYFSQNTKLRRKYQTQTLTRKVDSSSAIHNFSALLNHCDKCGYGEMVQSLARCAENITNTYRQLHTVLESLHLSHITDASSAGELLHCKKLLEFILTDYQEAEELFHNTDFSLLRSVPACTSPIKLKTENMSTSPLMWYNKFSGIPGHQSPDTVVYNSSKDLERYRSLVFQNQLVGAQLDIRDYSAKLILPLLKSLEPGSGEFLLVLRCGYELLLLKSPTSSPVIVRDTIEED